MRYAAVVLFSLMFVAPALAKCPNVKPAGYPDCHPDRVYTGRSVVIPPNGGARAGVWGYHHYGYGYICLNYGYPVNCPYYELPGWNGPMEIRNPGGG